jgi:hypothetical protein
MSTVVTGFYSNEIVISLKWASSVGQRCRNDNFSITNRIILIYPLCISNLILKLYVLYELFPLWRESLAQAIFTGLSSLSKVNSKKLKVVLAYKYSFHMSTAVTGFYSKEIVISLEWASSVGQRRRYISYTYFYSKCIYIYMAEKGSNALHSVNKMLNCIYI